MEFSSKLSRGTSDIHRNGHVGLAMKKRRFLTVIIAISVVLAGKCVTASDLDDGISQPLEDSIARDDELGQKDRNVTFIKLKAKSDADVRSKSETTTSDAQGTTSGVGNMNSVVLGPGGSVRGDIIIIDQSRGNKSQVVDR